MPARSSDLCQTSFEIEISALLWDELLLQDVRTESLGTLCEIGFTSAEIVGVAFFFYNQEAKTKESLVFTHRLGE